MMGKGSIAHTQHSFSDLGLVTLLTMIRPAGTGRVLILLMATHVSSIETLCTVQVQSLTLSM